MSRRQRALFVSQPPGAIHRIWIALGTLVLFPAACAQEAASQPTGGATPPAAAGARNATNRSWFEDSRFGLTIGWGVYSLLDKDAWVMEHDELPINQYGKLLPRFHAARFDAASWVNTAKAAHARYLTAVAKNHDGFCMFASNLTSYDIVDATPYRSDPIKALADACHRQGIKLFLYYSLLDWHHPDYFPLGKTGRSAGREPNGQWKRYVEYYQGQIRELCTHYGEIAGFQLDGCWDRPDADWQLAATYRLIRELQPHALITNDRGATAGAGEDFRTVKFNPAGQDRLELQKLAAKSEGPIETCWTINKPPGHDSSESKIPNAEQLIHGLLGAAAAGANLNIEIRALSDGSLPPELAKTLAEVGNWLEKYGLSVYGTRRGPIPPQPWGCSTARGSPDHPDEIYLHILTFKEDAPVVFDPSIAWVPYLFGKKDPLTLTRSRRGLVLELPAKDRQPIDTIVTLLPRSGAPAPKAR